MTEKQINAANAYCQSMLDECYVLTDVKSTMVQKYKARRLVYSRREAFHHAMGFPRMHRKNIYRLRDRSEPEKLGLRDFWNDPNFGRYSLNYRPKRTNLSTYDNRRSEHVTDRYYFGIYETDL